MQTRPSIPSSERFFGSVPTSDTERRAPFGLSRNWTPSKIEIFGHTISVDIPTGNLIVSTNDVAYPYYNFSLGISRKYDSQEQHMQLTYLRNYPNVNPKPHWFGNWQFAYESDVDEVWHNTYPELHVTSGIGANGLFEIKEPDFKRNLKDGNLLDQLLRTYGVPGRTLATLGWQFTENDFLLRTLRGPFQILSGHFQEETLVDDINSDMWLFNPISGSAFHITSDYFYNIPGDKYRDVGFPLIVNKLVDVLGHLIELKPSSATPPFKKYILSDGSAREFHIELNEELTFLDGLNPGGEVRKYLISKITDNTKRNNNVFECKYNNDHLLREVIYPSATGNRFIRYHYSNTNYPGVLTAIENNFGDKIQFEYIEDPADNDERLNPRLKVKKIIDPEGVTFEYHYDHVNSSVSSTVSASGNVDRKVEYQYIRDRHNTKKRYITLTEVEVVRGYMKDSSGTIIPRPSNNPEIIRRRKEYTNDGRFNVEKEIDPLSRVVRYKYNEYNQVEKVWDFDNHWTRNTYDIPMDPSGTNPRLNPSGTNPRCYDLRLVEQENIFRTINQLTPRRTFVETIKVISTKYEYDRYGVSNSQDNVDHGIQSTHRIFKETDSRNKDWTYSYDDLNNYNSLTPTLRESPLKIKTYYTYNNLGEQESVTDPERNIHKYKYNSQGQLKEYEDPNGEKIKLTYYPDGRGLHKYKDQLGKITEFGRETDGRIKTIIDPVGVPVDYVYYNNGRLHNIIHHRPAIPQNPRDPVSPSIITPYANLKTEIFYSSLGNITRLKSPKGLELVFDYDEDGRLYHWYHNVPGAKYTKSIHDASGQLVEIVDRKGKSTVYTYYNSGFVKTIQYPNWNNGTANIPGKLVEYKKYDYLGRILSVVDSEIAGVKEFMYDEEGNLVVRRDPDGFELHFSYDDDERLWKIKDLTGEYELLLNLDDLGRPKSLKDSPSLDGSLLWKYVYKKRLGSVTKVLNLYEQTNPLIGLVKSFDYDKKNRLKTINHSWSGAPPTTVYNQTYSYRDDDLIKDIIGNDANSFRYDGLKQLVFESTGNLNADFDQAGNRLYRVDKTLSPNPPHNTHNQLNLLQKDFGLPADFSYDKNGNMTASTYPINPTQFHFDGNDRLRIIRNSQYEITYIYDQGGKLLERKVHDMGAGTHQTTRFRYLRSKPIGVERDGNPFLLLTWDPSGALLRIRRSQAIGSINYPNSLFPIYDGLNNIVRLVDGDKNFPVSLTYDPWGGFAITDPASLFEFWGYRGGFLDRRSGYILFGARWYWPEIGRWLSEDPLPNALLGIEPEDYLDLNNQYVYTANDPVNRMDGTGLATDKQGTPSISIPEELGGHIVGNPTADIFAPKYGQIAHQIHRDEYAEWLNDRALRKVAIPLFLNLGRDFLYGAFSGGLSAGSGALMEFAITRGGLSSAASQSALTYSLQFLGVSAVVSTKLTYSAVTGEDFSWKRLNQWIVEESFQGFLTNQLH